MPNFEARSKGLSAIQTIAAVIGVILVAEWYFAEQPDAARLKFDQALTGAPAGKGKALVIAELTISNVGGHSAYLDGVPYSIWVQQVSPILDPRIAGEANPDPITHTVVAHRAENWNTIAYYLGGQDKSVAGQIWKATGPALSKVEIQAGENENFYFRATIPCAPGLRVSVSSRFKKPADLGERWRGFGDISWMKQSFLDLTDICKAVKK